MRLVISLSRDKLDGFLSPWIKSFFAIFSTALFGNAYVPSQVGIFLAQIVEVVSACTSHSAYDATSTESNRVKIDGLLNPNFT